MLLPAAVPPGPAGEPRFWPQVDPDEILERGPRTTTPTGGEDGWDPPTRPTLYGIAWRPPPNPHDAKQVVARLRNLPEHDLDTDIITRSALPRAVPTPPHGVLLNRVLGALREL